MKSNDLLNIKSPERCPKCSFGLCTLETEEDGSIDAVCASCGSRTTILKPVISEVVVPQEDIAIKARKLPGLPPKEAQKLYRKSPAGKAAVDRYRYSELFYLSHAKHRQTQTYRDTQARFKEKRRLFNIMLNPLPESTCPLNLFYKGPNGEIYHNREACDFNNGDCKLGCITHNGVEP